MGRNVRQKKKVNNIKKQREHKKRFRERPKIETT